MHIEKAIGSISVVIQLLRLASTHGNSIQFDKDCQAKDCQYVCKKLFNATVY